MSERDVTHSTFTLERVYPANRSRVFAAWADPAAKAQWFAGPNGDYELDFRVGGRELARGRPEGGPVLTLRVPATTTSSWTSASSSAPP
jgi:uncharacterized protein YndB with AHSA1/START domain